MQSSQSLKIRSQAIALTLLGQFIQTSLDSPTLVCFDPVQISSIWSQTIKPKRVILLAGEREPRALL